MIEIYHHPKQSISRSTQFPLYSQCFFIKIITIKWWLKFNHHILMVWIFFALNFNHHMDGTYVYPIHQVPQKPKTIYIYISNGFHLNTTWALHCYALPMMMKWQKRNRGLVFLNVIYIYIQIVQNIAKLSSKGIFN